ncbi:hypothetical protein ABZY34_13365 [Streptomyces virginiae]|uniref:hypothetical protein n=1 Tax=Streptomyces virginiae TaxID=1961 RepID=UPI0033A0EEFD
MRSRNRSRLGAAGCPTLGPADRLGVPAVLTNAVRCADPGQRRIADVLERRGCCG